MHAKNIQIKLRVNSNARTSHVKMDWGQFSIVMQSLLNNAIKFSHPGNFIKVDYNLTR